MKTKISDILFVIICLLFFVALFFTAYIFVNRGKSIDETLTRTNTDEIEAGDFSVELIDCPKHGVSGDIRYYDGFRECIYCKRCYGEFLSKNLAEIIRDTELTEPNDLKIDNKSHYTAEELDEIYKDEPALGRLAKDLWGVGEGRIKIIEPNEPNEVWFTDPNYLFISDPNSIYTIAELTNKTLTMADTDIYLKNMSLLTKDEIRDFAIVIGAATARLYACDEFYEGLLRLVPIKLLQEKPEPNEPEIESCKHNYRSSCLVGGCGCSYCMDCGKRFD